MMDQFEVWHADGGTFVVLVVDEPIRHGIVMRQLTRRAAAVWGY